MSARLFRILLLILIFAMGSHRAIASDPSKAVWVFSEDHGDKPGVELRVSYLSDGKLNLEMWLFSTDEKGKIKERVRFPITVLESDAKSVRFEYGNGAGEKEQIQIRFAKAPADDTEPAVKIELKQHQETKMLFRKSGAEK
jgi:hypothetical protein